jgi:putative oxidoreductase
MKNSTSLQLSLCLMRISIFTVMLLWALDKFINPGHSAKVFENFYAIPGLGSNIMAMIGGLELAILAGFILGIYKKWTYGAVLLLHAVSTVSSYKQYLSPFEGPHLLFFAAWPMLAGCLMLYLLRDDDRLMTLGK